VVVPNGATLVVGFPNKEVDVEPKADGWLVCPNPKLGAEVVAAPKPVTGLLPNNPPLG
jgi:hypothetical protein